MRPSQSNVGQPIQAADPLSSGSSRLKAGCRQDCLPHKLDGSELDWQRIHRDLDAYGCALVCGMLSPGECVELSAAYADDGLFRSRVVMARHGFGRGEYKYF